jgi:hypothetical protein
MDAALLSDTKPVLWIARSVLGRAHLAERRYEEAQREFAEAVRIVEAMWWPLWTVGFAQVQGIKESIVSLYLDLLRVATSRGHHEEVERVLALCPWSFLRQRWEAVRDKG